MLKKELSQKHDVPLYEFMPNKQRNVVIANLNRAAVTLIKAADKLPAQKKQDLQNLIMKILQENHDLMKDTIPEKILNAKEYGKDILNYCHSISQ